MNGNVSTDTNGNYQIQIIDGTYTVTAQASGYNDSSSISVTTPGNQPNTNFQLGSAVISVGALNQTLTLTENSTSSVSVTVSNTGNSPLTYSINTPPNYLTSDDVGGPAYNWIDISGTGNRLNISNFDDSSELVSLNNFTFDIYDNNYSSFYVGTNGVISFWFGLLKLFQYKPTQFQPTCHALSILG